VGANRVYADAVWGISPQRRAGLFPLCESGRYVQASTSDATRIRGEDDSMSRHRTIQVPAAIVVAAFLAANAFSATGLHGLAHEVLEEGGRSGVAAHSHGHEHGARGGPTTDSPASGSTDECSCLGTCAGGAPPLLASSRTAFADGGSARSASIMRAPAREPSPRPTSYLFPFPNAPPVRA
jgi:hypothetical protein